MSDTISRQAAIDAVKCGALSAAMVYGRTEEGSTALVETVKAIKALPSAQPERKRGRWRYSRNISSISYSDMMVTCDQCGYTKERCHGDVLNFCPNCGADMRERREE